MPNPLHQFCFRKINWKQGRRRNIDGRLDRIRFLQNRIEEHHATNFIKFQKSTSQVRCSVASLQMQIFDSNDNDKKPW